jgi:hypothetical protein
MRDMLFRNMTSQDHRRKVLATSEIVDKDGIRTVVRRHFAYFIRQVAEKPSDMEPPYLFVIKQRNTVDKYERFYCRMKGSLVVVSNEKFYKINFMHSLKICLNSIAQDDMKYSPGEQV